MKTIVLVSCGKTKHHSRTTAENLYQGALFKKSLKYARSISPDAIYILSAEYGLLELSDEVDPYEKTLNRMRKSSRIDWAERVKNQLAARSNLSEDRFIFLTGQVYGQQLSKVLKNHEFPLKGLSFGRQLAWLGERVNV